MKSRLTFKMMHGQENFTQVFSPFLQEEGEEGIDGSWS